MKIKSFKGGVHPPSFKELTTHQAIENMPLPQRVVIPLQQHTGAIAEPLVNIGDEVFAGQKIGEAKAFVSAPVHASISGKVSAIEPHPHPVLPRNVMSVVIEKEGAGEEKTGGEVREGGTAQAGKKESTDGQKLSAEEIKEKIREAGIVGLGGAAFPTHVKLSPPPEKKIDAVILNGVECEPYLNCDYRLMLERPREIIEGLKIILQVLAVQRAYIGIEENRPQAIAILNKTLSETKSSPARRAEVSPGICVIPLKVKYPQGAEKQLIKAILNREVPPGGLPFDVGVLVQNVGTALAIYEAVVQNKPLIERVITVTGSIKNAKNLRVRIGTLFSDVLNYCGTGEPMAASTMGKTMGKVLMGGPMMGIAQYTLDVPVIKGTSGILIQSADQVQREEAQPCIRCGKCIEVCPMNLMPCTIADYAENNLFDLCREYNIIDCMECGACAYICPAKRQLVHLIKYVKAELAKQKNARK